MNDMQKDQIRYELLRCITSLQDAFAYCNHAELFCREKLERWLYPLAYWYLQKTEE